MARRIVPGGITTLSVAVVVLAATASGASAKTGSLHPWYCPTPPTAPATFNHIPRDCLDGSLHRGIDSRFDFGDRKVATTSPAQRFALMFNLSDVGWCSPTPCPELQVFNASISISGDYAQTNNCAPTLSLQILLAGRSEYPQRRLVGCIITVTFAPTAKGPRSGSLSTGTAPTEMGPTVEFGGRGVTRRTPPALPLLLSADVNGSLDNKVTLRALTNNDSTVVASGDVRKTTKGLEAGELTKFRPERKHPKRLERTYVKNDRVRFDVKFTATDEFGQTKTVREKTVFCRRVIPSDPWCDAH